MVPKLHAKGKSFRGAAAYLLHDKDRAESSDRVAWTETRNIATQNADMAWRVMAATALDQARLKEQAGVKNTGRKSIDAVLHMTLSWHPDEKEGLTREEMLRAAYGAIRALDAEDRQALFVCHDDEPQPHLHVLLNRVSPSDGRMLSSSKEKLALSRWAQAYEKGRGEILCEDRVLNNAARDRGEYVRGEKDKPRHIYELEAANDDRPDAGDIRREQRQKDAAAAKRDRAVKQRQAKAWSELLANHANERASIREQARVSADRRVASVRETFRPSWRLLFHEHQAGRREFEQREERLIGRVQNAAKLIDLGAVVRAGDRRKAISDAFQILASSGGRLEALKRTQAAASRELAAKQRAEEERERAAVRAERDRSLALERTRFAARRAELLLQQRMDQAAMRATWKTRTEQREQAWTNGQERGTPPRGPAASEAEELARAIRSRKRHEKSREHDSEHEQ